MKRDPEQTGTQTPWQPTPVDAARRIGEFYDRDIVIVVDWQARANTTNFVTWGRNRAYKLLAAEKGEAIAKMLKLDDAGADIHQDFRREGEAAQSLDRICSACRDATFAIRSVLALREGGMLTKSASKDLLEKIADQLDSATTSA